jgi:hypothetical protein
MKRTSAAAKNAKLAELKATDLARFNVEAEKEFQLFLCKNIATYGPMDFAEATREVAFAVNVGLTTAKKYLLKHTVRAAHFCINGFGQIDCRPHGDKGQEEPESRGRR